MEQVDMHFADNIMQQLTMLPQCNHNFYLLIYGIGTEMIYNKTLSGVS